MKFLPTIHAYQNEVYRQIESGRLKVQTGQWIQFSRGATSRFVCLTKAGTIWAIHPSGGTFSPNGRIEGQKVSNDSFSNLCEIAREKNNKAS